MFSERGNYLRESTLFIKVNIFIFYFLLHHLKQKYNRSKITLNHSFNKHKILKKKLFFVLYNSLIKKLFLQKFFRCKNMVDAFINETFLDKESQSINKIQNILKKIDQTNFTKRVLYIITFPKHNFV